VFFPVAVQEHLDIGERAFRQWRRDRRHNHNIGVAQDLLAGLGQAGRTIENDPVIILAHLLEQFAEMPLFIDLEKQPVEAA
jgi:hypothetical protein